MQAVPASCKSLLPDGRREYRVAAGADKRELRPELYFVKVDVKSCFDTIKQDKLLALVEDILSEVCSRLSTSMPRNCS